MLITLRNAYNTQKCLEMLKTLRNAYNTQKCL